MNVSPADLPLVLLGAGGHAKVLLALALAAELRVRGVCDPKLAGNAVAEWQGLPVLGGDEALDALDASEIGLVNGIGHVTNERNRQRLYDALRSKGFRFPALIHPAAWVAPGNRLEEGVQIMAGAIVQPGCCIGENSVINTRASVDHDCTIGRHVHIAPGVTLCGGVLVADHAFVGSGATVIQGVRVGPRAVVGAGTTLVRNLPDDHRILGPAARPTPIT